MTVRKWIALNALLLPLSISVAQSQEKPVDPDKLPKVACSDLHFSAAFLAKYPTAPAACVEARILDGTRYAKFMATVYISDPDFMTVELLDVAGNPMTTFSFKPSPQARVHIDGKEVEYTDLKPGETLTIWVAETRLAVYSIPSGTAEAWTVLPPR